MNHGYRARLSRLSSEHLFLLCLTIYLIHNLGILYKSEKTFQLDSFEDLTNSLLECSTGNLDQNTNITQDPKCPVDNERLRYFDDYELDTWLHFHHVEFGGRFRPPGCRPRQKVAIVVPIKDQKDQLERFSMYIHQFLPDQLIDYQIFVIEQLSERPLISGLLFNIGVNEIRNLRDDLCCYIFHDVNLMPLDQRNLYMCTYHPRILISGLSTERFKSSSPKSLSGAIAISSKDLELSGGFSDKSSIDESDNILHRLMATNLGTEMSPSEYGLYMVSRVLETRWKDTGWRDNAKIAYEKYHRDVSLEASYVLRRIQQTRLYTRIAVEYL